MKHGNIPFGYQWSDSELIFKRPECHIYGLAFEFYFLTQRIGSTARMLNERGFRSQYKRPFSSSTVRRMLTNPVAKGVYISNSKDGDSESSTVKKSAPAIVSEDVWSQVQTMIAQNAKSQSRSPTQDIFVSMIDCRCGTPMELPSKSAEYKCSNCEQRILKEDVLTAFLIELENLPLPSTNELTAHAKVTLLEDDLAPSSLIKSVEKKVEQLFTLHESDAISEDIFRQRFEKLDAHKKQLLSNLDADPTTGEDSAIDRWHSLPFRHQRLILENLIEHVVVSPKNISFSFFSLFNFAQQAPKQPL